MTEDRIDRAFVRLTEGLVHLRRVEARGAGVPLVLLHASPGSSRGLVPLLQALAVTGDHSLLIAPDTLGNGDSAPTLQADPDIAVYADATMRLLDALGIETAAFYGTHTGARIACEIGARHPARVARIILDGIGDYEPALRDELIARYAPEVVPDDHGGHLVWAFHFVRDQALHFPHYARDPAHRLMTRAVPNARALHDAALEVLKGLDTYHRAYRAAFAYPTRERIALVERPIHFLRDAQDLPSLHRQLDTFIAAASRATVVDVAGGPQPKAAVIAALLG